MSTMKFKLTGKIKVFPEDFVVEEVWRDGICTTDAPSEISIPDCRDDCEYLHFTLIERNWDTIKALRYLARKLHVSIKRFSIAGLKDKRALTAQRVSVWRCRAEDLARIRLPDITFKDFSYSDERINLGDAEGNRLTITIRDIPLARDEIASALEELREYVRTNKLPNFFGPQRTGRDLENVKIGRAIIDGNLEEAVNILLGKVKRYIELGRTDEIPDVLWLEKRVINHLKLQPRDYAGALRKIPKRVRRIFISAVQAQLFNERLARSVLAGEIPEFMEVEGFEVRRMPELSAPPVRRRGYLSVADFEVLEVSEGMAKIRFTIGKGEYATTFLSYILETRDD